MKVSNGEQHVGNVIPAVFLREPHGDSHVLPDYIPAIAGSSGGIGVCGDGVRMRFIYRKVPEKNPAFHR